MIDIRHDCQLLHLKPLLKKAQLPSYVEEATLDQCGFGTEIPKNAFADVKGQKLPCHTKSACFVSALYFAAQQPSLDSKVAQVVEAKLAEFIKLHAIKDEELSEAVEEVKQAASPGMSPQETANALMLLVNRDENQFKAGELIQAARELKEAGASNQFVDNWSFDKPMDKLGSRVQVIDRANGVSEGSKTAAFAKLSPKRQTEMLPDIANYLNESMPTKKVREKLAAIPVKDRHDIKVAGVLLPYETARANLSKIAFTTDIPLYSVGLRIPDKGWEDTLESANPEQQRQVLEVIGQ